MPGQVVNQHYPKCIPQKVYSRAAPIQQPIQGQNHRQVSRKPVERHRLHKIVGPPISNFNRMPVFQILPTSLDTRTHPALSWFLNQTWPP